VSLAISALADLHLKQLRVAQGLEAPNQTQEKPDDQLLRLEALSQLEINKNAQHCWAGDCDTPFSILDHCLRQTNLPAAENAFLNLS